jgi:hypothetical protein
LNWWVSTAFSLAPLWTAASSLNALREAERALDGCWVPAEGMASGAGEVADEDEVGRLADESDGGALRSCAVEVGGVVAMRSVRLSVCSPAWPRSSRGREGEIKMERK